MSLTRSILSDEQASQIKEKLWAGLLTQTAISQEFGVSQPMVSRIFRGLDFKGVPWPDGSMGHIPQDRRKTIHASRNRNTRYQYDGRHGREGLDAGESEEISAIVDSLLASKDVELRSQISSITESSIGQVSKKMLSYLDIRELDPSNPVIQELEEKDDPQLKVALRIVCTKLPQEQWSRPAVIDTIRSEAIRIKEKIA